MIADSPKTVPALVLLAFVAILAGAQAQTPADILRGAYGPYRANNDLLFYHLDVRVDPETKFLRGKNRKKRGAAGGRDEAA